MISIPLLMEVAEDEKEGDEDDGLDHGDEGEIVGQMAVVLLDGEQQDGDEKDGQGHGHHDVFWEFAHTRFF